MTMRSESITLHQHTKVPAVTASNASLIQNVHMLTMMQLCKREVCHSVVVGGVHESVRTPSDDVPATALAGFALNYLRDQVALGGLGEVWQALVYTQAN